MYHSLHSPRALRLMSKAWCGDTKRVLEPGKAISWSGMASARPETARSYGLVSYLGIFFKSSFLFFSIGL